MQETQINGESLDIVSENVSKLKDLFPEIVTEDKIDFDKLKEVLGKYTEEDNERYNFTWKGKSTASRLAQSPSTGTLRPCKEESKNWDTTENLYIEGDNLEVLKLLQKGYYEKIKMIYIDPPYNTGKNFVYADNYQDNLKNYLDMTNQFDEEGNRISNITESDGRRHTKWINMIYPRLSLARNLLAPNGVIFISIDDNEVENLRKICDEIFGEENRLDRGSIIWINKGSTKGFNKIVKNHEYILGYAKNSKLVESLYGVNNPEKMDFIQERLQIKRSPKNPPAKVKFPKGLKIEGHENIKFENVIGNGTNRIDIISGDLEFKNGVLINDVVLEASFPYKNQMIDFFSKIGTEEKTYDYKGQEWVEVYFTSTGVPYFKKLRKYKIISSILENVSNSGYNDLKKLDMENVFDNPKPVKLIKILIDYFTTKEDIILDFFLGSGTTIHSSLELSTKNKRIFIGIQYPENIYENDKNNEPSIKFLKNINKPLNISEICKERIRRAGDKVASEMNQNGQVSLDKNTKNNLDTGFKVFKLDSSNLSKWDPEYDNIEQTLLDSVKNIVPGRNQLDLIYEIMLKYGIDLTLPLEEYQIKDKTVFSIGFGALMVCLEDNMTSEMATEIIKLKDGLSPEVMRVVFKDNGFASDSDKTNIKETLKINGIDEFVTI